jgi:GntR family transcriptional regulator / MocR family aminotransferase
VEGAYQQLIAEGYVKSIPRIGVKVLAVEATFFSGKGSDQLRKVPNKEKQSEQRPEYDFVYGEIDTAHLPLKLWRRYLQEVLKDASEEVFMYGDPFGDWNLRQEVSHYLLQSRGVSCQPEQIVMTAGTQHAVSLLCQLLALHGSTVAYEDPGYDGVRSAFMNQGCRIAPIPIEADGVSLSHLHRSKAKLVYVTPSHQLPCGMILPVHKRSLLLEWANEHGSYIVEDDYDSEFRYQGQPIPALKALDKKEKVIYLGTFSKCFLPAIRVSYIVLPAELVDVYKQKLANYNQAASPIIQRALYTFMKNGDFERHIRRMKKVYKSKHQTLLKAVETFLGKRVTVIGEKSGLHVLLNVHGQEGEELMEKAIAYGVKVYSTNKFWHDPQSQCSSFIMLGFGKLSEEEIVEGIRLLQKAWF